MKYYIVNKATGISHDARDSKEDADKLAKEMTEYHRREYIVKEVN